MPTVELSRKATREIERLSNDLALPVQKALKRLEDEPPAANLNIKPLVGREPWMRLRVGVYRVLYSYEEHDGQIVVAVARIVHRKNLKAAVEKLR